MVFSFHKDTTLERKSNGKLQQTQKQVEQPGNLVRQGPDALIMF
jgi:hypothetical protein